MPPASSSRRAGRPLRREISDVIEEDGPSQALTRQESIDEEDGDVRRPRRIKGANSGKTRLTTRVEDEEDDGNAREDDVEETEEDILASLGDQPLDKTQHARIQGMASDWNRVRQNNHVLWYSLVKDVGASMAEFAEGEEGKKDMKKIDGMMKGLLDAEYELLAHEEALQDLQQRVARGEPVTAPVDDYGAGVKRRLEEYKKKTTRQKYAKSDQYASFQQGIFEVQHPGAAMPPVTDLIPKEDGDVSDDEDVEVGGVTQDYKCPLTLTILVNPLTSRLCKHSFSAEAIREYLKRGVSKTCPMAGCNKVISLGDLEENKELKKKAENAARRERMREQEDEGDEDDVVE